MKSIFVLLFTLLLSVTQSNGVEPQKKQPPMPCFGTPFKRILKMVLCALLVVGGLAYFYISDPVRNVVTPPCFLHENTGLFCAGCGGTRAAYLILHGELFLSFRYNCFCIIALCGVAYFFAYHSLRCTRFAIPSIRLGFKSAVTILCVLTVFTVLRNIPIYPLTLLAPPDSPYKATQLHNDEQ